MSHISYILSIAFTLDLLFGDPVYRLHPVRLIGVLISATEKRLRSLRFDGLPGGALLTVTTAVCAVTLYLSVYTLLNLITPLLSALFSIYIVYSCIALRDMLNHATPIKIALWGDDIAAARLNLAKIVGRDVSVLDKYAVARATVESVAESFVDGFFAPVFWFSAAGITAAAIDPAAAIPTAVAAVLCYRCINSLDSMVGYKNERYLLFGRASALSDDVFNFLPARLSLLPLGVSAFLLGEHPLAGWRVALRDRLKHASPNSAHTESFVAGALGLRLGGATVYPHGTVDKAWLGDGTAELLPAHINAACKLVLISGILTVLCAVILMEFLI